LSVEAVGGDGFLSRLSRVPRISKKREEREGFRGLGGGLSRGPGMIRKGQRFGGERSHLSMGLNHRRDAKENETHFPA